MSAKLTPNLFLRQLSAIVKLIPNDPPIWTSESDFPIHTIGLEDGEIMAWVPEQDKTEGRMKGVLARPVDYLADQYVAPDPALPLTASTGIQTGQILVLMHLFGNYPGNRQAVYKRVSEVDGLTNLYLLVRFGTEWIGLTTRIVET